MALEIKYCFIFSMLYIYYIAFIEYSSAPLQSIQLTSPATLLTSSPFQNHFMVAYKENIDIHTHTHMATMCTCTHTNMHIQITMICTPTFSSFFDIHTKTNLEIIPTVVPGKKLMVPSEGEEKEKNKRSLQLK